MIKWICGLLALLLVGGGIYWVARPAAPEKKPEEDTTAKVERGPLLESVASDGKLVSNLDVEIKCKASGKIVRLPFDVSALVKRGDLLVELDPVDEERNVRQAEASLAAALARLSRARENLAVQQANLATDRKRADTNLLSARARATDAKAKAARVDQLLAQRLASREEAESAATALVEAQTALTTADLAFDGLAAQERALGLLREEIKSAEAEADITRVSLDSARQRLTDTRVFAPMDGVVTAKNAEPGQIISSPMSNVGGGSPILTLSDLTRLFVLASVDESDIGKVRLGQAARIRVDAFPQKYFDGLVVRISPRGVNVSNVVTFEVKIEVVSPEKALLRPEMTANVEIEAGRRDSALAVPTGAIFRKGGGALVSVLKPDGTEEERPVRPGISDGQMVEIINGLAEGETVKIRKTPAKGQWQGRRPGMMGIH